jgi:hypothetical protein
VYESCSDSSYPERLFLFVPGSGDIVPPAVYSICFAGVWGYCPPGFCPFFVCLLISSYQDYLFCSADPAAFFP